MEKQKSTLSSKLTLVLVVVILLGTIDGCSQNYKIQRNQELIIQNQKIITDNQRRLGGGY